MENYTTGLLEVPPNPRQMSRPEAKRTLAFQIQRVAVEASEATYQSKFP